MFYSKLVFTYIKNYSETLKKYLQIFILQFSLFLLLVASQVGDRCQSFKMSDEISYAKLFKIVQNFNVYISKNDI